MAMEKVKKIVKKIGDSLSTKERENIQPEEQRLTTSLIPAAGDANVGHYCFYILGEVIKDKDKKMLPEKWLRNYELFRAKHWRKPGTAKLSQVNLIWNYIIRTTNLLTDQSPTFDIHAENDDLAGKVNKVARFWWNETEQQDVLADSVMMSEINGCVIEKVIFNTTLNNGIGEVETITVDPHNFGFWPLNEKRPHKWEAAMHFYTLPVNQVRRRWPEMAQYVKPDKDWRKKLGEGRREIFGGSTGTIGGRELGDYGVDHASFTGNIEAMGKIMGDKDNVLIVEFWVKDYTMETVVVSPERIEDDGFGNPVFVPAVTEKRAKYPGNIRCITSCSGGDVVLSDRPNPSINPLIPPELAQLTYLWSRFPFSLTPSNRDIVSPWGFSSIEQLESMNFEIDKCLSQLNMIKDKAVRSPIINPRNANVPNSAFTNAPAKVINPKDHVVAAAIGHMKPPPHHRDIEQILMIYREMFDKIAGIFDMTDPSIAKGRMAYKTVATIIESMHTMLRGKIRGYDKLIRERGRMWLSHAQNFYTEDRTFFVEREGGTVEQGQVTNIDLLFQIHFSVEKGSTMPTSRLEQREEAKELFGQGALDIRELLIRLDWPNKAEVIRRMEMGQFGVLLDRMQQLQVDEEVLALVQNIAQMDEAEYNAILNQMKEAQANQTKGEPNAAV